MPDYFSYDKTKIKIMECLKQDYEKLFATHNKIYAQ